MLRECCDCHTFKPVEEFYKSPHRTDGLQIRCKKCYIAKQKVYAERNGVTYYAANRPERLAYSATYKKTVGRGKEDKRKKVNREARRYARLKGVAVLDLSAQQWQEILEAYNFRCAYCPPSCWRCHKKKHTLTQDHIDPIFHGGNHTLWNVVPACQSCNSTKRTGPPLVPVQPLLLTIAPKRTSKAS